MYSATAYIYDFMCSVCVQRMHVCMYVCLYECMYVCMSV